MLPSIASMKRWVPSPASVMIALALQFAATAELGNLHKLAIWIAALGIGFFVWKWSHSRRKLAVVFLIALFFSLPSRRMLGGGKGGGGNADYEPPIPVSEKGKHGGAAIIADQTFPGVILFPEVQDHATLVPPLPSLRRTIFQPGERNPLDIPFFGSYFLFKYPQSQLPKSAITMRGDPDQKVFRSTDLAPMRMEAHQNLGAFFEVSCCRAIEVAIRNRDKYPGSVEIELELRNTAERTAVSLGRLPVISISHGMNGTRTPMFETLSFAIPAHASLRQFDEFSVRFVLARVRADHSAGISIQRFSLQPR